ncbi:MAG: 60S ribosomal protein L26, partial [Candidatus Micrarchaeota archaeon]|nr:60S ribosomal protein L26 [Candidatus Micrarchaeota archaeon]
MIFMIESSQPRKQRLFRANAPMHIRQNFVNVHISKDLAKKLGIKRRSIEIR